MDIRKVKKLIELLEESQCTELEINEGEESVRISRGGTPMAVAPVAPMAVPAPVPAPAQQASAAPAEEAPAKKSINGHEIKSPMVGTLYHAPSPEAPAFVEVGQTVKVGQTLCLIEAMKMFNPIEAEVSGTIAEIVVDDGAPVEYGQTLFIIEK